MKSIKHLFLFEANKKRPSGIGKVKDLSKEENVEFIAGDIYDLSGNNRYTDKFKYYRGEGNGYISDKDGNYYDVETSKWSSDTGRIAGGTMNFKVTIKNVKGQNLVFTGYSAIFSSPSHATIVADIENGTYLEDFLAKHWGALSYSTKENDELKELRDKGDANAKTFKQEKDESAAKKKEEFFERYLTLPDNISFEIKNDDLSFRGLFRQTRYNASDDEKERTKNINEKISNLLKPFCVKKLKEFFKTDIANLNGLSFGVKPVDKSFSDNTAIDSKENKLVVIHNYGEFSKPKWKLNKDAVAELEFYPTASLNKNNPSEFLKDLFTKASEAYLKLNSRQKTKYVEEHWKEYFDWYGRNDKTSVKGEARKRAEEHFFKDIESHDMKSKNWQITFEVAFLKDFIEDKLPADTEKTTEEKPEAEKKTAPKFTGKLAEQEKKMDAWHNGTRKQNVEACSDAKLKVNYDICKQKGYDKEAELLKKEADARGLTLESLNLENIKLTLQDYIDLL